MDIELLLGPLSTINTQSNVALSTRNWSCYRWDISDATYTTRTYSTVSVATREPPLENSLISQFHLEIADVVHWCLSNYVEGKEPVQNNNI